MSTSVTGILTLIIVTVYHFGNLNFRRIIKLIPLLIVTFLVIGRRDTLFNINFFAKLTVESLSQNLRVFKGLEYFQYLKDHELPLGIGLNNLNSVSIERNFVAPNYASSIIFAFISFGLIGGTSFIIYLINLYKNFDTGFKSLYIILLLILLTDQVLFNHNLIFLLVWVYYGFSHTKLAS